MLSFYNKIVVFLCGINRAAWADKFTRFFQNATCVLQSGRWVNESTGQVDQEDNIAVGAWVTGFDEGQFISNLIDLCKEYKEDQHQEAIMFEVTYNGMTSGRVVFDGDWEAFRQVLDPIPAVIEFFEKVRGGE